MIPRFMRSALMGVLSLGFAASVHAMPIADFVDDFANPEPAGWSYLWNANGAIGTATNYSPLLFDGSIYTTTGVPGLPNPAPGAFTLIGQGFAHPGPGTGPNNPISALGFERYAIAAYTVGMAGLYSITDSFIMRGNTNGPPNLAPFGAELLVFINDLAPLSPIFSGLVGTASPTDVTPLIFDTSLGNLNVGDVIYVAVGPNGSDQFDTMNLDFTITKSISEPGTLAILGLGIVGLGFARRRKAAA